jgi:chromosome partitioning protein
MIVVVGGTKGGTGKSTIVTNLITLDINKGHDAILVDADKQGSAAAWAEVRDQAAASLSASGAHGARADALSTLARVPTVQKYGKGLVNELKELARKYKNVFVDAGGFDSEELRAAIVAADLLLIPVRPAQFDVWTLPKIIQIAQQSQLYNPTLQFRFVVNGAHTSPNVKDADEVLELLGEEVTVCKTVLHHRRAYAKAPMQGMAVTELQGKDRDPKAHDEMTGLYEEVITG